MLDSMISVSTKKTGVSSSSLGVPGVVVLNCPSNMRHLRGAKVAA